MRALMWIGLVAATTVALLIACVPGPKTLVSDAEMHPWPPTSHQPLRLCDEKGICCYSMYASGTISCAATRIIVIVSPGEVSERGYSKGSTPLVPNQGDREIAGEVQSRAIEERFLQGAEFRGN